MPASLYRASVRSVIMLLANSSDFFVAHVMLKLHHHADPSIDMMVVHVIGRCFWSR